jgi:hypothetical protein
MVAAFAAATSLVACDPSALGGIFSGAKKSPTAPNVPSGGADNDEPSSAPQHSNNQQNSCVTATCGVAAECANTPCICNDGRIVNSRGCNNACCATAAVTCQAACASHRGYSGRVAGAGATEPAPAAAQPAQSSKAAFSKSCRQDSDCESRACLFKGRASMGYCTKECTSFSECPFQWECKSVRNGSSMYCVQDHD